MNPIIPPVYRGREQTLLKHLFLRHYLVDYLPKLGSFAMTLRFCDPFAGPWKARGVSDTSAFIGLSALNEAGEILRPTRPGLRLAARFIATSRGKYRKLEELCAQFRPGIDALPILGLFEEHVDELNRWIGRDPAFVFVDPTGWKGVTIEHVRKLARGRCDLAPTG